MQLQSAMRGGFESLLRASQAFNPQNLRRASLGRYNSLGRQSRSSLTSLSTCLLTL